MPDGEADDMKLQEETGSVSTAEDADNVILRGDSAVRPSSDFTATSVRPPSDSAASSIRRPPENTAPVGFKGGTEVRLPINIFPTEYIRLSTLPNNSVNPPGTSSEESALHNEVLVFTYPVCVRHSHRLYLLPRTPFNPLIMLTPPGVSHLHGTPSFSLPPFLFLNTFSCLPAFFCSQLLSAPLALLPSMSSSLRCAHVLFIYLTDLS
jgi:hypothetical protein